MEQIDLKALRETNGWNQQDLADRLGVDQATVSRIERGVLKPSKPVARLIDMLVSQSSPQDGAAPLGASAPAGPGEPDLQPGPAFSSDVLADDGLRTGRAATPDGSPATCPEGETNPVQEAAE